MTNQFSLKISSPCSENFDRFITTRKGGFCDSCTKEVIDFTSMNSQEITTYFQNHATQNTCGRFKNKQLTTYTPTIIKRRKVNRLHGLGFALLTLFSFGKIRAQDIKTQTNAPDKTSPNYQDSIQEKNITVKGTVTEDGIPLPGASVVLNGTTIGTSTDFDGNFEFPEKLKKGDVLIVSYIGFNSKKIVVQNENSAQSVTMEVNLKMDACILMGKVAVKKVYKSN